MKTTLFTKTAGALAIACAGWLAVVTLRAQPLYDRIHVNLPYTITMQDHTLQPGDYTIQQLPSASGDSRVLLFYSKDGMKFETSAMTIPTLDPATARDTKLVLNHVGEDYYISKIWVQGKDYGYELPVPNSIKSRQNERITESTVPATYQPSASTETTTATTTTTAAATETAPPANANSNNTADTTNRPVTETPAAATTPAPVETAQAAPQPIPAENSADRAMPDQTPAPVADTGSATRTAMPATAAGWLTMLLSGTTLSGAGLMLRRKRS
jgi:hypothetical protein